MKEVLRKSMPVGFIFGIIFSIIAYLGNFTVDLRLLCIIPFLTATMSGLGAIIAYLIGKFLEAKELFNTKTAQIIAFLVAALVNSLIVIAVYSSFDQSIFQRGGLLGITLGLGMGAIYGIYHSKMDSLKVRMEFLEALADKNKQLQETSRRLAITEERNRMGRELHDSVSQGLHGLVFSIHSLRNECTSPSPRMLEILSHMEATTQSTLDELKTMIEELKPSILVERGLGEAIEVITELFSQRNQIPIELDLQLPASLSPELEMTLYRITQESLGNIEKHAFAQHVSLKIIGSGHELLFTIRDDGKGFNTKEESSGNGLKNIRQRVEEAGATLNIVSRPTIGTSIIISFPPKG